MKINIQRKDTLLFLMQLSMVAAIVLLPSLAALLASGHLSTAVTTFKMVWSNLQTPCLLYFANFYLFWPWLFAKKRYGWFALANILMFVFLNFGLIWMSRQSPNPNVQMPAIAWIAFSSAMLVYFLLNCAVVAFACGLRHFLKNRQIKKMLEEERHKNTEAELAWLKNQINPHFLFNTLNNISSLTQIDPDAAQDAIAQLSDLLRYAIYKTDTTMVPIQGEVEFMRNYIELMKLRCNEKTAVTTKFQIENPQYQMAPLIFISLIENAFKHGVSSNKPSTIDISLIQQDGQMIFESKNTNYAKSDTDRSGSGIGLENTRRRLELIYHDHYVWQQQANPNIYQVKIIIQK